MCVTSSKRRHLGIFTQPLCKRRGFTLMELAFVIVIITAFVILLTPFINKIRTRTKLITCEENLQKIGLGLNLYASEHQGKFPPDLGNLVEDGYIESKKVLDCPSSPRIGSVRKPDYHYITAYTISSPSDTAIVFDRDKNHKGGKHVLYISGDIRWEN